MERTRHWCALEVVPHFSFRGVSCVRQLQVIILDDLLEIAASPPRLPHFIED